MGPHARDSVWSTPDKLRAFNVTVAQVADAVRAQNMEVPGGRIDEGTRELTVRTMGRIVSPSEFNNLIVGSRDSYSVKLSDVGYAEDGGEEPRTEARLNGQPAVTLVVSKQSGQNTVAVAEAVKARLQELRDHNTGFKTSRWCQSILIRLRLINSNAFDRRQHSSPSLYSYFLELSLHADCGLAIPKSLIAPLVNGGQGFTSSNHELR